MLLGSCSHNKLCWLVILYCDTYLLVLVVHFELTLYIHAAVGAEADDDRIQLLLSQVEGKDITELIAAGREKLASVPAGGGAACAVAAPGGGGAAAPAAAEKKEEKKVEEKEESDDDMGFSLFD